MNPPSPSPQPASGDTLSRGALNALVGLLGSQHVLTGEDILQRYSHSTAARPVRPAAVVRPASTEEVVGVVKLANEHGFPIYPISCGHNWGYGDACAPLPGQVIVDLARMNQIHHLDETLAYCVIGPGVTQGQLSDHLHSRNLPLWMDCTGAGPDTSLVGNVVERGFGHSPYGNRLQIVAGWEVVLPDGRVLNTGFGHIPQAKATYLYPFGVGPFLDGLFTQSNLGIVTRMGLWLMPASERVDYFLCFVREHEDIAPVVEALRPLRMSGNLRSVVHITNDLRLISGSQTYPWKRAGGRTPLPEDLRLQMRAEAGAGAWTVTGALHGTRGQVAAARRSLNRALKGPGRKMIYISERLLQLGELAGRMFGFLPWGSKLKAQVEVARSLYEMNRGVPNGRFLNGSYWRRRGGVPDGFPQGADPALDGCGMLWLSPIVPARGEDVLKLHDLIDPLFRQYGFEPFITLSLLNERTIGGVLTVAYDKEDAAQVEQARACYQALFDAVWQAGYPPYRVGLQSMADLDRNSQGYWDVIADLKRTLDPNGILAPGRYEPARMRRG